MSETPSRDRLPEFLPTASLETLKRRDSLLRNLRSFFHERDFMEVETPALSADSVVDRHLDPLSVEVNGPQETERRWLQTSPEFGMKRLLAAGAERIFQITRAFRADERGARHNPEFTMLEWYRAGDDMQRGIELLCDLVESLDGLDRPTCVSFGELFRNCADIDVHNASARDWRGAAERLGLIRPASFSDQPDEWMDLLLVEVVEPALRRAGPTVVFDYPASQAALARVRPGPPAVAERFELYVNGLEIANGYHELLDADELARRQQEVNAQRLSDGKAEIPSDNRLLAAMRAGLPACAGVALGVDRLLMALTGTDRIDDVLTFPWERA